MFNSEKNLERLAKKIKAIQDSYIYNQSTEKVIKNVDEWGRVSFETVIMFASSQVPIWRGKVEDFI